MSKVITINEMAFMRDLCATPPHVLSEPFRFAGGALATDRRAALLMKGQEKAFPPNKKLSYGQQQSIAAWLSPPPAKHQHDFADFKKWTERQSFADQSDSVIAPIIVFGVSVDFWLLWKYLHHLKADKIQAGPIDTTAGQRSMLVIECDQWRLCVMKCLPGSKTDHLPRYPN